MSDWVPIRRHTSREALLVERSVLESAGIAVWVPEQMTSSVQPYLAGGFNNPSLLHVLKSDVDEARAILRDASPEDLD